MTKATLLKWTINPQGEELMTFLLTYPMIIHAELMTHRMFSRNSASARAIPFKKMVKTVKQNMFIPHRFQKHHSGMQGTEYLSGLRLEVARFLWRLSAEIAIIMAKILYASGVTKQLCNRWLYPFSYTTTLVTTSEPGLLNFFKQRTGDGAEIHIKELAEMMRDTFSGRAPEQLKEGEFHIPFDVPEVIEYCRYNGITDPYVLEIVKCRVAIAKCARTSYTTYDKDFLVEDNLKLFDRLLLDQHMSPFEHVAQATNTKENFYNLKGYKSFRYLIETKEL